VGAVVEGPRARRALAHPRRLVVAAVVGIPVDGGVVEDLGRCGFRIDGAVIVGITVVVVVVAGVVVLGES